MKIAVELRFDSETRQWCAGMMSSPWIASCGRTPAEAKLKFLEAFEAYFEAPRKGVGAGKNSRINIELVTLK